MNVEFNLVAKDGDHGVITNLNNEFDGALPVDVEGLQDFLDLHHDGEGGLTEQDFEWTVENSVLTTRDDEGVIYTIVPVMVEE